MGTVTTSIGFGPREYFTIEIDRRSRTVRANAQGFWSAETTHRFAQELEIKVGLCRRAYEKVKVVIDARELKVLPVDATVVLAGCDVIYAEGDRVAIILGSSLAKGQAQRTSPRAGTLACLTTEAAESWVEAELGATKAV